MVVDEVDPIQRNLTQYSYSVLSDDFIFCLCRFVIHPVKRWRSSVYRTRNRKTSKRTGLQCRRDNDKKFCNAINISLLESYIVIFYVFLIISLLR